MGTFASPNQELALKLHSHQSRIGPVALTTRGRGKALARDKMREGIPRLETWGTGVGLWKWKSRDEQYANADVFIILYIL